MSEVGDLLELLHGAGGRWSTVRLTLRRWSDDALTERAMRRAAEEQMSRGASVAFSRRGHGDPGTWESTTRAWVDRAGDRMRTDVDGPHGERLNVRVGSLWWTYTALTGAFSNESDPRAGGGGGEEFDWMLDPSPLLPALDFTVTGTTEVAGRAALAARAAPRALEDRHGFAAYLVRGADEVALAVDRERGVLLRAELRIDGRPYGRFEVADVAFDEVFADDVFRFVPPDGSAVRSMEDAFPHPEPVSVEEAARRASFTVLVPGRLPRGWTVDAAYSPAFDRPPRPDSVTLHVRGEERLAVRVWIHQFGAAVPDHVGWEEVEHEGVRIFLFRHAGPMGTYDAKAEIEGTHVRASGNVDRDALLDIVAGLRPAPRELPPWG